MTSTNLSCDSAIKESTRLQAEAHQAAMEGNDDLALEKLTASIESDPSASAYHTRATLLERRGDDEAAIADCKAGLALDPKHSDMKWLLDQLEKPKEKRFQAPPPSASK